MTKKINNHNIDGDELLNRVKTGNSEGLDDFEKEAFEGFAALDNNELATKLNAELNKKIEEKYMNKTGEKPKFMYYAMAAGLVLVVGLSVLFFNDFTKKEESLAYKPETSQEIQNSTNADLEKEVAIGSGVSSSETVEAEPKKENSMPPAPPAEKAVADKLSNDDRKPAKDADASSQNEPTPRMITKGPLTKTAAPIVAEEQKQDAEGIASGGKGLGGGLMDGENKKTERKERDDQPDLGKDAKLAEVSSKSDYKNQSEEKTKAKKASSKTREDDNRNSAAQSAAPAGVANTEIAKNNKPERAKEAPAEKVSMDELEAKHEEGNAPKTTATSGVAAGDASAVSLRRSSFFKTAKFNNHIDYIKTEIDKNEKLKTSLIAYNKAFRIDLTVNEKGKVTDVKADLTESKCADSKKEIEKIILNMPNWEPAQSSNGVLVKQTFYFNYKY